MTIAEPWADDHLERQNFAIFVMRLMLSRYQARKSFIVNLDAPWGQGKSYFLTNLAETLRLNDYPVAYVNAWAEDRGSDPLIPVLASVNDALAACEGVSEKAKSAIRDASASLAPAVMEVGKQVGLHVLKGVLGISMDKVIAALDVQDDFETDYDALGDGAEAAIDKIGPKLVAQRLKAHQAEKAATAIFRDATALALASNGVKLPLFIIIDELDRCRPDYAVRMLEDLKHIFEIEGVIFLIGTDSLQLSHSINALYGAEFDSITYLRRFFDRIIVFPPVDRYQLVANKFRSAGIDVVSQFSNWEGFDVINIFRSLFEAGKYTNRDIDQYFEILETFCYSWDLECPIEPVCLAALIDDYRRDPRNFPFAAAFTHHQSRKSWSTPTDRNASAELNRVAAAIYSQAGDLMKFGADWVGANYFRMEEHHLGGKKLREVERVSVVREYRKRIQLASRIADL